MSEKPPQHIPEDLINWISVGKLKQELAKTSSNWENSKDYDRARALEDLISQITSYLVKNKL